MQQALRKHAAAYLAVHRPDPVQHTVLRRLVACRTAALGGHLHVCSDCGWQQPRYNSCKDRHCSQCQGAARAEWLVGQERRMLPVPHFQVVFTLPSQLRAVALCNQALVYAAMFEASAYVLQRLAHQRLDADLGITTVLHTWSSDLRHHPHVHCLVTAGGLGECGWVATASNFLFPHRVMAALFKGRLMATLQKGLTDEVLRAPRDDLAQLRNALRDARRRRVRWVVHVEPPEGRSPGLAARYLARYARGVALADARVLNVTAAGVSIATKTGAITLDGPEFVRRLLLHVLPPDFRKIRHYGLYAPGGAVHLRERAAALVGSAFVLPRETEPVDDRQPEPEAPPVVVRTCPSCGSARLVSSSLPSTHPSIRWTPLPRGPP